MDNYIELAVFRKNNFKDTLLCFVASILPLVVGTFLVFVLFASGASGLLALGIIACAILYYIAYKIFCSFTVEWEYTLVGNELRFSKIINKNKRRDLFTVSLEKIEVMAKKDDAEHNRQLKTSHLPLQSYISQTDVVTYFFIGTTDKGRKVCVEFEPDYRMIDNFKTTLRGKFYE